MINSSLFSAVPIGIARCSHGTDDTRSSSFQQRSTLCASSTNCKVYFCAHTYIRARALSYAEVDTWRCPDRDVSTMIDRYDQRSEKSMDIVVDYRPWFQPIFSADEYDETGTVNHFLYLSAFSARCIITTTRIVTCAECTLAR